MDKEIIKKISEVRELNKVLFLDHDEARKELKANMIKLNEVEDSLLNADKKYDQKRERG